jgi:putative FmdB family regulatory protein
MTIELANGNPVSHKFAVLIMPTYEYVCPKCHHTFEQFQSMNDAPLQKCPACKKTGLKRLIGGGAGLIFKGSGFYITDYKNKKPAEKPGADSGAAEKPAPAKPEAKPDTKPSKPVTTAKAD